MRIFDNINQNGKCIICKKNTPGKACLISVDSTEEDGNIEAVQAHVDCINLHITANETTIYQIF